MHTAERLNARYAALSPQDVVCAAVREIFPERIALVSSFGTESAVLLHMIAVADRATPVLFLDTLKHFDETLAYRDRLITRLRLTGVRSIRPATSDILATDPDGMLWARDADACCDLRKTQPLGRETMRFQALFTGRKRHHGSARAALAHFEADGGRIKVNPLVHWDNADVTAYLDRHGLPRHPLADKGYPSVGCAVCTSRVTAGEDFRAGRWRDSGKTECGIHKTPGAN